MALMTTSTSFKFYKLVKDPARIHCPIVYKEKLDAYRIGPSKGDTHIKEPSKVDQPPGCLYITKEKEHKCATVVTDQKWKGMSMQQRTLIRTLLGAIDIVTGEVAKLNFDEIKRRKLESYRKGFIEPAFWKTKESETKAKRDIENQELFILNREFFGLEPLVKKEEATVDVKNESFSGLELNEVAQNLVMIVGKQLVEAYARGANGGGGDTGSKRDDGSNSDDGT